MYTHDININNAVSILKCFLAYGITNSVINKLNLINFFIVL